MFPALGLLISLFLAPQAGPAKVRVARAPETRSPRAAVARAGAERAARRELDRQLKARLAADPELSKRIQIRYGSDGGVELWLGPESAE